jgi:hypothetical protein
MFAVHRSNVIKVVGELSFVIGILPVNPESQLASFTSFIDFLSSESLKTIFPTKSIFPILPSGLPSQ